MKKRAQAPDAQTYTIIFNGCSGHSEPAQALVKVLSIYRSMRAEKSPIKPNIKHINAVLKMCARANDMDALFATASEIPKSGIGAADCLTYTTILNALRMNAIEEAPKPLSPRQKRKATEQAILRARLIWADVVKQWRKGDVFVDENLVCTMGRLLVLGGPKDSDDIFSLIEQTMNIPRQLPPMGTPERSKIEPTEQGRMKDHSSTEITNAGSTDQPASADHSLMAIEPANTSLSVSSFYAKPGRNSLGLIMQALLEIKQKSPAALYWDIFTKDHGVIPDSENFHGYLRILRGFRSSTEVVELLLQMPKECMEKKTFRIAMSSCKADKLNRHAFGNAGKILDLMSQHLVVPDIPALECYLTVAIESKAYSPKISSNGEPHPSKYAQGRQILRALDRINPSFDNVKSLVAYGDPSRNQHLQEEGLKLQVLLLAQNMVRAYDVLIAKTLVPREMRIELSEHRGKLAAYITRSRHNPLPKPIHPSSKRLRPKIMSSQDPKGHLRARSRASDSRRS
jgi:hypothetical protein